MDSKNIEKMMKIRERGYIFLEYEMKRVIIEGAAVFILMLFLLLTASLCRKQQLPKEVFFLSGALALILLTGVFVSYKKYRRIYNSFEEISKYLEQFEDGNYHYQKGSAAMKTGIQAQIIAQLERLGPAFDTMKGKMTEEKENTKVLVTDISHQLKTPLAALQMSFELMNDQTTTKEEWEELFERAEKEVKKLRMLMEALTNLSRMEAGVIQTCAVNADIRGTLVNAVNSIYMKAYEKAIEIEMQEFEDITILHDPKWTAEAVINILDNAIKYSASQTTICIRVTSQMSFALIEIEDEGIGIAKEEYPYIFKRFYRGKSEAVGEEGSGVGLYLVRKIIEEQGGSVRVVPGKARGSRFQILLPKGSDVN